MESHGINNIMMFIFEIHLIDPPKSVSVSISASGEIKEGDSVTLNCSSDSNPPALYFSWFKGETFLKSGDTYSITNIKSEASGNFYCSATNEHGSNVSAAVTVNVMCKFIFISGQIWLIIFLIIFLNVCHFTLLSFQILQRVSRCPSVRLLK